MLNRILSFKIIKYKNKPIAVILLSTRDKQSKNNEILYLCILILTFYEF